MTNRAYEKLPKYRTSSQLLALDMYWTLAIGFETMENLKYWKARETRTSYEEKPVLQTYLKKVFRKKLK